MITAFLAGVGATVATVAGTGAATAETAAFGALLKGVGAGALYVGKIVGNVIIYSMAFNMVNRANVKLQNKLALEEAKRKSENQAKD